MSTDVGNTRNTSEDTSLGRYFAERASDGLSGVYHLHDPVLALQVRLGLALKAAKTLDLQYYLWKGDLSGTLLLHRALEAADRGVKVRLLIDDIYHSGRDEVYAALDAHPNFNVRVFNPLRRRHQIGRNLHIVINKGKLNRRMHNKIFLVDGAVAILGGRNIGDDYFLLDPELSFRDLDVLAAGQAADDAGSAYDLYWNSDLSVPISEIRRKSSGTEQLDRLRERLNSWTSESDSVIHATPSTVEEAQVLLGELRDALVWAPAQIIVDPIERFKAAGESAFVDLGKQFIDRIESEIVLQSAYLIPTRGGMEALRAIVDRGVRVRMLTNSMMSNNHISVHAHYAKYRRRLLKAGVELYEYRSDAALRSFLRAERGELSCAHAGLHTKAAVADRRTTIIGSYNLDPRSRNINSEIGLLIESEEFAARVLAGMKQDFDPKNSYRLYLDEHSIIRWEGANDSGLRVHFTEPDASIWRRSLAALIRLIPVEDDL
ncbi:MAG: phospholipase D family protein [Woeseiaceae bacterium]|nr:phospholipase D family protein [Woeseiaceae bacterium]